MPDLQAIRERLKTAEGILRLLPLHDPREPLIGMLGHYARDVAALLAALEKGDGDGD